MFWIRAQSNGEWPGDRITGLRLRWAGLRVEGERDDEEGLGREVGLARLGRLRRVLLGMRVRLVLLDGRGRGGGGMVVDDGGGGGGC